MIPASAVRPTHLAAISPLAVVIPVESWAEPFLVFGAGEDAMACFIGENHKFETMPAVANTNWNGLAIEGLQVEVDIASAYSLDGMHPMIGSVVRSGPRLELVAKAPDGHGFRGAQRFVLQDDLSAGAEGINIAFKNWKLILRDGERILFERSVEAEGHDR